MIDRLTWQKLHNAFHPARRLWGDEVEKYYVARPYGPLDRLKTRLDVFDPTSILLFGHTGSGKSSELARLVEDEDIKEEFFIVWIDSERNLDIFDATQIELLFLMGISIFQIAEQALPSGKKSDPKKQENLIASLETLVQTQTSDHNWKLDVGQLINNLIIFGLGTAAALGSGAAAGLATAGLTQSGLDLISSFTFKTGGQRKEVRALEVRPEIHNILEAVNEIIADVEEKSSKPVLLIVDGLDKFDLDQSKDFFIHTHVLNQIICRTVFVTPLTLYYSADFSQARERFSIEEFPNIALYPRDERDAPIKSSYDLFREVIDRRLEPLDLSRDDLFADDALDLLIQMSGGVMREFIRLVQTSLMEMYIAKGGQVMMVHAEEAVYRARRSFKAGLTINHFEEIENLLLVGTPSGTKTCDELLKNLYILSYINHNMWHDVHPNVLPLWQEWQQA